MPKKAQKGGGGKDGGKTGEKRLQQRAQTKEEMAKKREEILKAKLQKEEEEMAASLQKVNEGWKSILSLTEDPELRHDFMVVKQKFERNMDSLDSTMKNLGRGVQESERQAVSMRRLHMQHAEHLRDQKDKLFLLVQQQGENSLQQIRSTFDSERKQMLVQSEQLKAGVEDIMLAAEQRHNKVMEEIDTLYNEENKSNKSAANMKSAMITKELVMEKTGQNQEAAQACSNEQKNQECTGQINKDMMTVKSLQLRMNSNETENQSVLQDLTDAKNQMKQKTQKLRDQLTEAQTAARKQLTDLTVQSDNAAKKLRTVIAKGERVLRVAEMCRKLESEQKDISALFSTEEHSPERTVPDMEEPAKEASGEFPELRQVTQSINTAILKREALKKHRDDLSQENQQLRLQLSQQLEAMKVSDDTFGHHALLTVRQAPTTTGQPGTNRRHVVKRSPKD